MKKFLLVIAAIALVAVSCGGSQNVRSQYEALLNESIAKIEAVKTAEELATVTQEIAIEILALEKVTKESGANLSEEDLKAIEAAGQKYAAAAAAVTQKFSAPAPAPAAN